MTKSTNYLILLIVFTCFTFMGGATLFGGTTDPYMAFIITLLTMHFIVKHLLFLLDKEDNEDSKSNT